MISRGKCTTLLLATSALSAFAGLAGAQTAETSAEELVVTGTRLRGAGFTAPTPITSVSSAQLQSRAPTGISEVLNELPAFRATFGSTQSQRFIGAGAGQAQVDLRGLGTSRTLVLVNGRRVVGQNVLGTVDTNVIPAGLLDHVDVVTGGASAAYGSDAVSGVVNMVLKDRLDGVSGSLQLGSSEQGDNEEVGLTFNAGRSFMDDRVRVVFGADYNRNDGVGTIYERKTTSLEPGNTANPIAFSGATRPAGTPAQGFLPNIQFSTLTQGSVINAARAGATAVTALNQTAFNPNGSSYNLVRGTVYGNLMSGVTSNYGFGPLSHWNLRVPNRREAYLGAIHADITNDIEAFVEVNYAKTFIGGFSSYHTQPTITIVNNNPFIPADLRARMTTLGVTQIDLGRIDTDWNGAITDNNFETLRTTLGVNGKIFGDWEWDAYFQHGKTDGQANLYHTRESNLLAAEYVVTGPDGRPACGPLASNPNFAANRLTSLIDPRLVTPGCVPFNPFGVNNTPEAIAYVSGWQYTQVEVKQQVAALNLSGEAFTLPAGPVSLATGLEFRKDELQQTADALQILGIYGNGNNKNYGGQNEVGEGYVEVGVPLLKDMPFVKSLAINGAARRTHYENSGWVTTWKVGATYEPNDWLRLRATQSRDIRAPNLNELFLIGGTSAGANMVRNPFTGQDGRLPVTPRGNLALTPERADTFTAGVVLQPTWDVLSGLRASIDYYDIQVEDVISTVGALDVLNNCFRGVQFFCSQVELDSTVFGVRNVNAIPFNQAQRNTNGVDLEVAYRVPLDAAIPGRLDLRALVNWTDHLEYVDRAGTSVVTVDWAGSVNSVAGVPTWTYNMGATYALGNLTTGLQARWFSSFLYDPRLIGPDDPAYNPAAANSINYNRFPTLAYVSANAAYDFTVQGHKLQAFGVVNNLLDKDPPVLSIAALNSGGNPYDYVGRTYKVGLRFEW